MSVLTDYFTAMANKIRTKTGKNGTLTPDDMVDEIDVVYSSGQANPPTQTKSCTPTTSAQTIEPDNGKFLSSVSVSAIQTQTKSAPAIPSGISFANGATVTPDSGKFLSSVTIPKPFGGSVDGMASVSNATLSTSTVKRPVCSLPTKGYWLLIVPGNEAGSVSQAVNCSIQKTLSISYTVSGTTTYQYIFIVRAYADNAYVMPTKPSNITSCSYIAIKLAEL